MRTQDEIRERFDSLAESHLDPFGFRREALLDCMEFDTAVGIGMNPEAKPEEWARPDVATRTREYLRFAIGKAVNHREISAGRSIEKLAEWLWVLDDADLIERFEAAPYPQYGAPKLRVLEDAWLGGQHDYAADEKWWRMRAGEPCSLACVEGCGL